MSPAFRDMECLNKQKATKEKWMEVEKLERSGLPLYLDNSTGIIALSGLLKFNGMGRKQTAGMKGLLADENNCNPLEDYYDTYRGIVYPEDENIFVSRDIRYDITVVMPGQVNGECKKTSGHYHGWNTERTHTFPEVYEVISGTAMYILQRSDNFEENPDQVRIQDLILVTVKAGQTLLVPPDYGHASVNIGNGPLVFSNLAYTKCPVLYDSVKAYHGMTYFVMKDKNDAIELKLNDYYKNADLPKPKMATVRENPKLGIDFHRPAYLNFKENPDAFDYLPHPDAYVKDIMDLLIFE